MPTPCDEWTVHELINHMCEGAHLIAGAFEGPPDVVPDFLPEGPMNGLSTARRHREATSTPDVLTSLQQMPFGQVLGEAAVGSEASAIDQLCAYTGRQPA